MDARRTAVLLAMGRDRAEGRIELRGPKHRLRVVWDTTRNDPLYADEQALAGQVVRAFGGTPFATPMWRLFRQPVTVHNLGGVPMGDGPDTGAASPDGEVFGHPRLYVLDGALLPGATGGNPSLTITAVAERCAQLAVRRITGDASWRAPEHAGATRGAVPEDAAVQSVRLIGPRRPVPPGVRFAEAMAGTVGLPAEAGPATPARRYDATVPTGRVRVGVADTLRMLSSVRATGTPPGRTGAGTVLRFSAFFAGQVARAYLGRR
ncbi:GMC oxidoreductase [Actinoplanes sp. NPDC051470]|uniref:GMC oxidoreductase n=1 Tax=Actinoplanes sp. NPDC051470 TaxID=3157224 RepID=UPI00343710F4